MNKHTKRIPKNQEGTAPVSIKGNRVVVCILAGYKVETAADGEEGLEKNEDLFARYHVY